MLALSAAKPNEIAGPLAMDSTAVGLLPDESGISPTCELDTGLRRYDEQKQSFPNAGYRPILIVTPLPTLLNAGTVVVFRFSNAVRVAARSAWSLAKLLRWATVGS